MINSKLSVETMFCIIKKKRKKGTVLYSWSRSNLISICDTALLVTVCRDTNINGYWANSNVKWNITMKMIKI
jgi:hypothetical protein